MPSSDFIPATSTAEAAYRRAVAKANDEYGTAMTVAGVAHLAAFKAIGVSVEVASATADTAFDAAEIVAGDELKRATTAARMALTASTEAK